MIDPALLREDPDGVAANYARRGFRVDLDTFQKLDTRLRTTQRQEEELRARRNVLAQEIGSLKRQGAHEQTGDLQAEASKIGIQIKELHTHLSETQEQWRAYLLRLPNILHPDVPAGVTPADNREVRKVGELPTWDFEARDHVELGRMHGILNFEMASAMSQSRFSVLVGAGARLHRALAHFMVDVHTQVHGYCEHYVPYLVNENALTNTGQLPKFGTANEFFSAAGDDLHLIPTAEVSLANLAAGRTFNISELPLRWVAHTPCFRREAGSYGKDTRGMLRQHQFDKVELVQVTAPEQSSAALTELVGHAERILQDLELPYRVVELCAGDTGNAANHTFDLEVFLPGQGKYREISSCSNVSDFQARRMNARLRLVGQGSTFVHLLNGSGVAVGRAWLAVVENNQDAQGNIRIPPVLRPYMDDMVSLTVSA